MLIVGAGPSGLAVAAALARHGVACDLVDEHGAPGGAYARAYAGMRLASPARYNALPGLPLESRGDVTTAGGYHDYLARYASHHRLGIRRARVARVERRGGTFIADDGVSQTPHDAVVAASGMFAFPKGAPIAGLESHPAVIHAARWQGPQPWSGKRLLVVGGGTSAVEIAEECAAAGVAVCLAARRLHLGPRRMLGRDVHDFAFLVDWLPPPLAGGFCRSARALPAGSDDFRALQRAGRIVLRGGVARFEGTTAHFAEGASGEFDGVVLATGYRFETPYLPAEVARREPNRALVADAGRSVSWPGLFVVGHACTRRVDSQFLRGIARDALRVASQVAAWTRRP